MKVRIITMLILFVIISVGTLTHPVEAMEWSDASSHKWNPKEHRNLVSYASEKENIPYEYQIILSESSEKPDIFDKDWVGVGGQEVNYFSSKQWLHGYFVDLKDGGAPKKCKEWVEQAEDSFKAGNSSDGYKFLGYATHYICDLAQPMHTDQTLIKQVKYHIVYEDYVTQNWDKFVPVMKSYKGKQIINDPVQACIDIAKESNKLVDRLWNALDDKDYNEVDNVTIEALQLAIKYTRGIISIFDDLIDAIQTQSTICITVIIVAISVIVLMAIWIVRWFNLKKGGTRK